MEEGDRRGTFTDETWAIWEPLIEAVLLRGKTQPHDLRRTIAAIFWRDENGAKWWSIPAELGPWWRAAQLFIRWTKLGVGTPARTNSGTTGSSTRHDFSGLHEYQSSPQGGGSPKKRGSFEERDHRGALGRSRGGYGTKICVIADGHGKAVGFALESDPPFLRNDAMGRSPAQNGPIGVDILSRTSGLASRSGAPSQPDTKKQQRRSSQSSTSLSQQTGSSANRPKHYFGRMCCGVWSRRFPQCGHCPMGGRRMRSRMACRIAGRLGCDGGPPTLFFPPDRREAPGLEKGVGHHGHQGVSVQACP